MSGIFLLGTHPADVIAKSGESAVLTIGNVVGSRPIKQCIGVTNASGCDTAYTGGMIATRWLAAPQISATPRKALEEKQVLQLASNSPISSDTGHVKYPPIALRRWKLLHTRDGIINIRSKRSKANRGYRCPSVSSARWVIRQIPPVLHRGEANPLQSAAFSAAIKKQGCRSVFGRYAVISLHESAFISIGYEVGEDWTALTVTDSTSQPIGLVYDASFD